MMRFTITIDAPDEVSGLEVGARLDASFPSPRYRVSIQSKQSAPDQAASSDECANCKYLDSALDMVRKNGDAIERAYRHHLAAQGDAVMVPRELCGSLLFDFGNFDDDSQRLEQFRQCRRKLRAILSAKGE